MIYQKIDMAKKVLVVGFGSIGCRHAQSLLNNKEHYEIHILEPSRSTIEKNLKAINARMSHFTWYENLEEVPMLDFAIISTSSSPRFEIIKYLLKIGFKKFLVEKIVNKLPKFKKNIKTKRILKQQDKMENSPKKGTQNPKKGQKSVFRLNTVNAGL